MSIKCEHCGTSIRAFKARRDFENRKLHLKCWKIEQDVKMVQYEIQRMKREEEERVRKEAEWKLKCKERQEQYKREWDAKPEAEKKAIRDKWDADELKWKMMTDYERDQYFKRNM